MSTELVYRMRTCAAALASGRYDVAPTAAADLLIEASNLLDIIPEPLGELMPIISNAQAAARNVTTAQWGGNLPPATPQPCPSCGDATSARTARRQNGRLMLTCPMCSQSWEYGR